MMSRTNRSNTELKSKVAPTKWTPRGTRAISVIVGVFLLIALPFQASKDCVGGFGMIIEMLAVAVGAFLVVGVHRKRSTISMSKQSSARRLANEIALWVLLSVVSGVLTFASQWDACYIRY